MRSAFDDEGFANGRTPLLITVAGPADPDKFALIQAAVSGNIALYPYPTHFFLHMTGSRSIHRLVQCHVIRVRPRLCFMHYGILADTSSSSFYGNWENYVEVNAPIADTINAQWSFTSGIEMYLNAGVPGHQIYGGLPLYGRVWTLEDTSKTAPGSPGSAGIAGRCTAEVSFYVVSRV